VGHWVALTFAAVVILGAALGIASAYPSHAYQTAATSGELASVHTYCMTVGSFASVSPPWQIERRWPLRIGILGTGILSAFVLFKAAKGSYRGRLKPSTARGGSVSDTG
jgi:amino acid transporter